MIIRERNGRPDWLPLPVLPSFVFEDLFFAALYRGMAFASECLGLTFPCFVELGLLNTRGMHIRITTEDIRGPVHAKEALTRIDGAAEEVQRQ
jgi:hypothetical protein